MNKDSLLNRLSKELADTVERAGAVYGKLGVSNRTEALNRGVRRGLITL